MDLITTHVNADFDALGSLVAAKKLYPQSRLLLPGSQEEAVRDFLSLAGEQVVVETERECAFDGIDRLILVDTRQKSRIGAAGSLVDKGVEVHVYDHHPRAKGDVVADKDVYEEVGATVTILTDIIKKKGIRLSYIEATLMLIGIYEETGSLTFRTTTRLDVDMVSFLLSQGASLPVVSSYINRELSQGELSLLSGLIHATRRSVIKGVSISFIELDQTMYSGELGLIIQKFMEIENIPALFVLIKTSRGRIDIIGRSKVPTINVNKTLAHFGGGGHPGAASAKVHDADLSEVKKRLVEILKKTVQVTIYAEDIMSRDIRAVGADEKVDGVRKLLIRQKLGGMPVIDNGRLVGIITLVGLNKAIKAGYGHSRVRGYMTRKVITVKPETPLYAIEKIVMDKDTGVIPVLDGHAIVGVINRTDVLRSVYDSLFLKPRRVRENVVRNLRKKMAAVLPGKIVALLKKIGAEANACGYSAFVVGGLVRDLLKGIKNTDLDIVVEGDAIKLGTLLANKFNATIVIHKKFGTCSLYTESKMKIDLATARKETYEKPAALPTVEFSSLKDDLIRRDFTINAMALSINRESFGRLIDFFSGERDLSRGRIKVLHDDSFIDDPTRIFRAVRFESRFGFAIDHHTEELIKHAIDTSMFDKVEPQRIRDELILILRERSPLKALKRMAELEELRFIHPELRLDTDAIRLYAAVDKAIEWYDASLRASVPRLKKRSLDGWLIYLMALFDDLGYTVTSSICDRFVFRSSERARILSYKSCASRVLRSLSAPGDRAPSDIYRLLEPLSFEVILLIMSKAALLRSDVRAQRIESRIKDFLRKYNGIRLSISGQDLKAMGLKPSQKFKVILNRILYNKIDGKLAGRKEELLRARKLAGLKTETT